MILGTAGPAGPVEIDPAVLSEALVGGQLAVHQDDDSLENFLTFHATSAPRITWPPVPVVARRLPGPIQFVLRLLPLWNLKRSDATALLGFRTNEREHVTALLDGRWIPLGRDTQDRIAHLFRIHETLSSVFRDSKVENEWLRESHALLDGRSPMSILLDGSMEGLLWVKEYVEVTGRR